MIFTTLSVDGTHLIERCAECGAQTSIDSRSGRGMQLLDHDAFVQEHVMCGRLRIDLVSHLLRQIEFSRRTFGPHGRVDGVLAHLRKEVDELTEACAKPSASSVAPVLGLPSDCWSLDDVLEECVDVVILAFEAAHRSGATAEQIGLALVAKQLRNEQRTWPDWRTAELGKPIEHIRDERVKP